MVFLSYVLVITVLSCKLVNYIYVECILILCIIYRKHFAFFHCNYKPVWVLAFSVILYHSPLSFHCSIHPLIPIICMSSSIIMICFFVSLPLNLVSLSYHSHFQKCSLVTHPHHVNQPGYSSTFYKYLRFQLIHLVRNSFWFFRIRLHFALRKDFIQYSALKYSEKFSFWIC